MPETASDNALLLQRLQALAEETRLHLVRMLAGGERCVCELQDDLGGAAQSRLSFHLRKLKEAGLVTDRREGRWVYYTLVPSALDELQDFLGGVWAGRMGAIGGRPGEGSDRQSGGAGECGVPASATSPSTRDGCC